MDGPGSRNPPKGTGHAPLGPGQVQETMLGNTRFGRGCSKRRRRGPSDKKLGTARGPHYGKGKEAARGRKEKGNCGGKKRNHMRRPAMGKKCALSIKETKKGGLEK